MISFWPIFWFSKFTEKVAKNSKWVAAITAFFVWLTDLIERAVRTVLMQIQDAIESLDLQAFENVSFATIQWIGYANAVIPLSEMLVLLGVYWTAWVTIIIIRWVKSFVPTVAN